MGKKTSCSGLNDDDKLKLQVAIRKKEELAKKRIEKIKKMKKDCAIDVEFVSITEPTGIISIAKKSQITYRFDPEPPKSPKFIGQIGALESAIDWFSENYTFVKDVTIFNEWNEVMMTYHDLDSEGMIRVLKDQIEYYKIDQ